MAWCRDNQPEAREGQAGRLGVAARFVVPGKPGNAGGGKGPQFKTDVGRRKGLEIGQPINSEKCSKTTEGVALGFTHLGRLSGLYKEHCGEYPSESLIRS